MKSFLLLAALAISSQVEASPFESLAGFNNLVKRTGSKGCNADNALRNFRDKRYSSSASLFCSAWLQSTVTNKISVTVTVSSTATQTPPEKTVTKTIPVTITNTETTEKTVYPTAVNTFVKRAQIGYPTWLSATFPATRISSACSCFISVPSPVKTVCQTTTVATVTKTATKTLEPLTKTATTFETSTASATYTSVITGPEIECNAVGCANGVGFISQQYGSSGEITIADCKAFCIATSGCKVYQWGDHPDASSDFSFCNVFNTGIAEAHDTGSASDPTCQWYWRDVRCEV